MTEKRKKEFIQTEHCMRVLESEYPHLEDAKYIRGYVTEDFQKLVVTDEEDGTKSSAYACFLDYYYGNGPFDRRIILDLDKLKLDHMYPKTVQEIDLRNYIQGKVSYVELYPDEEPSNGIDYEGDFKIHLSDVLAQLNNIDDVSDFDFEAFIEVAKYDKEFDYYMNQGTEANNDIFFLSDSHLIHEYLSCIWEIRKNNYMYTIEDVKESILHEMKFLNLADTNLRSKLVKVWFVETYSQEANYYLYDKIPSLLDTYKSYAYELISQNDILATRAIAYLDYEGAPFWPINYLEAEQLLKKLFSLGDFDAANTLGYLYYYHNPRYYDRTCEDMHDYEKAYHYFSIGTVNHGKESKYKLADCFWYGNGVEQNKAFASQLIEESYSNLRMELRDGEYYSKFADVAFRMAKVDYDKYLNTNELAYLYAAKYEISEALFAIRKRYITIDYIGDEEVYKNISNFYSNFEFEEVTKQIPLDPKLFNLLYSDINSPGLKARFSFKVYKNNDFKLRFYLPKDDDGNILTVLGEYGLAFNTREIEIMGYCQDKITDRGQAKDFEYTYFYDENDDFVLHVTTNGEEFYLINPTLILKDKYLNPGKPHKLALVLVNNQKLSERLPFKAIADGFDLKANDRVLLRPDSKDEEPKEVSVFKVINVFENELDLPIAFYDKVIDKVDNFTN